MQAIICETNSLAIYIPCMAHSLNLVGQSAVGCCSEAVYFLSFVDKLYTFFSASTHRWNLLKEVLDQQNLSCVKQRSDTKWSADASAVASLSCGYKEIRSVLEQIAESLNEKPETKCDARGLANVMKLLETGIMTELWQTILLRLSD
jgi:hypothetical protein